MISHHQMTLEERVKCGKAWLDEHAPNGYVFNMFSYHHGKPVCLIDIVTYDHDVLALAFSHDKRFKYRATSSAVKRLFNLSPEESFMLGFDIPTDSSREDTRELEMVWSQVLQRKFWESCSEIGRLLAQVPKQEPQQNPTRWLFTVFSRKVA